MIFFLGAAGQTPNMCFSQGAFIYFIQNKTNLYLKLNKFNRVEFQAV